MVWQVYARLEGPGRRSRIQIYLHHRFGSELVVVHSRRFDEQLPAGTIEAADVSRMHRNQPAAKKRSIGFANFAAQFFVIHCRLISRISNKRFIVAERSS